jgi:taurine dioxygenase
VSDSIRSKPLSPALGAEVVGLDLRQELSSTQQDELRRLFDASYLLLFRGQDLSAQDQTRILETFGPVSD